MEDTASSPRNGDVVLISCYELGHQPMGLASPMAFLARAGFSVSAIDVSVDDWEDVDEDRIRRARLIALSVPMHTALRLGIRLVQRVRALNPKSHICFYGLYAALNADYLLANGANSILGGEFEQALVRLAQELARDGRPRVSQDAAPLLEKLRFPVPRREGLPSLDRYAHLERGGRFGLVGYVEASRGCLHLCRHCPIPPVYKGRFFVVPQEVVLADVQQLVDSGASHITFGDPDFLNGPGHSMSIARALHRRHPQVTFDFTAKVEHLLKYRDLLPELGKLGCLFVVTAVESLSNDVLRELDKGHTRDDAVAAMDALRDAGIAPRPTWVAFTPWTTLGDYLDVLDWIEERDLVDHVDPVQFSVRLLVPPGSSLLGRESMEPYLQDLVPETFTYPWTHPDPRMDDLHGRVTTLVEQSTEAEEDPVVTFARIRDLACLLAGEAPSPNLSPPASIDRVRAPRLTEAWFC